LVACTAFRNPALIAKIATAMDEVSEGRFTLGLGAGWNEVEFRAFGLPFDQRVARFEEALQIIVPLLRGGHVDFGGAHYRAPDCANLPRGPSPHGPPILVGAFGPRMLRLAARYAEAVNTSIDRLALSAACTEVGRDPATLAFTLPAWAAFPDLGPTPDHMHESTYTSAEELAEFLRALAQAGAAHVMIDFRPNTSAALARVVEALQLYHNNESI
jgi:alkanesulfonate monooxygenase SsuD/methylene tetrahydromethanopterin reductase-like flavin-dependent oxidoreductase (luciferase family)